VTRLPTVQRICSGFGRRIPAALGATAALAALSLSPGSAQAYVVTVGGVQYDVTTFTGSYNNNASKFALPPAGVMPWWGSISLTNSFAAAVGTYFGVQVIDANSGPFCLFVQHCSRR
jgi:hypothetical protein